MAIRPDIDVSVFLTEDIGGGDITAGLIPEQTQAEAAIITRESAVICGKGWVEAVFKALDSRVSLVWTLEEGQVAEAGRTLCTLSGPARAILTGERTALNLLQTLSATATVARQYAEAVSSTGCRILDTRKTIPGLRAAQKYAVAVGGCYNHRMGLYDGVLIKENHILAAGSIAKAVAAARRQTSMPVEVEVESLSEFREACLAKPDRIMLDNFSLEDMCAAVVQNNGKIELEASGNVDLSNIREIAATGVDYISIGALTKHIKAIDLSMRITLVH